MLALEEQPAVRPVWQKWWWGPGPGAGARALPCTWPSALPDEPVDEDAAGTVTTALRPQAEPSAEPRRTPSPQKPEVTRCICCRASRPGTGFVLGVPGGHGEWRGGQVHLTAASAPPVLGAPLPLPHPLHPPLLGTPPDFFAQGQMRAPPGRPPTQASSGARLGTEAHVGSRGWLPVTPATAERK